MTEELKAFISRVDGFDKLKSSEQIDFFAHFYIYVLNEPFFNANHIAEAFASLRLVAYSNIPQYLLSNSNRARTKKKKVKFIKTASGFHFVSSFENEIKDKIKIEESDFINFSLQHENLPYKPSDIPFLNTKVRKNADFFTKLYYLLYHLENSLRKFLNARLNSILGSEWEKEIIKKVDLSKAVSIRHETSLSEMIQDRGDSILYYCMWDDYGKIIKEYRNVFSNSKDCDEILAHLNSLAKIRNAIAHNTATIPSEYKDEMTLFLKKYVKIMKHNSI